VIGAQVHAVCLAPAWRGGKLSADPPNRALLAAVRRTREELWILKPRVDGHAPPTEGRRMLRAG